MTHNATPEERFLENVGKSPAGHWLWGSVLSNGYGNFWDGKKKVTAHRFAYELWVGPIPDGLQIDHLCRIRHCVNPQHLEPVTQEENMRRSESLAARSRRTGVCRNGHKYTTQNTRIDREGVRTCRDCNRTSYRKYRLRKAEEEGRVILPYTGDRTHCPRGHPYDEVNTYWEPDGKGRQCRECRRSGKQRRRAAGMRD